MKAKEASLAAKITAGVLLITAHILMWAGVLKGADSDSILKCCIGIMIIFGTVDINLMLEKFSKVSHKD